VSAEDDVDRDYDLRGADDDAGDGSGDAGTDSDAGGDGGADADQPGRSPSPSGAEAATAGPATGRSPDDGFGRRGWLLVGAVVAATLVIPAVIYVYPALLADRVPFLVAMLVLPFLPALLLGATAVWSMSESARSE